MTSAEQVKRSEDTSVLKGLVEMMVLQRCQHRAIYSPYSTFSVFAFAGNTQLHHVAYNAANCEAVELFEPCFRLWHWMKHIVCHHNKSHPWKLAWSSHGFGLVECINERLDSANAGPVLSVSA